MRDDVHGDEGVRGRDDEGMEPDDGGVGVGLEVPVDLHFVPSTHKSNWLVAFPLVQLQCAYRDLTRAAVVGVLDLCTSLTATR